MHELYRPASGPASEADFVKLAKNYDFIHLVLVDIHGIPRVKICPADAAEGIAKNGQTIVVSMLTRSTEGGPTMIPDHVKMAFGNICIRPVVETTRDWPWLGLKTGSRILQVLVQPEWLSGDPISAEPRGMAVRQLKRLHDRSLDIFCGFVCEVRLFKPYDDADGEPEPAHATLNAFDMALARQYEKFYAEMDKRMRAVGFKFDAFHSECGAGQLEFALSAEWGIKAADDVFRFKMLARDVADECGYRASFMTKVNPGEATTAFHFNHSVWQRKEGHSASGNVMLDINAPDKLSPFSKHWTAGQLHHANGLTAIWSPTVNCYRRLHKTWAPSYADWGFESRMTALRVKNGGTPKSTLVENRCPSSASNPYLVLASVIAAGLDGVDRNLGLVDEGSKEMGHMPRRLTEALEGLKKDEPICSALGEQFIEWFGTTKLEELKKLELVDIRVDRKEDYEKERRAYFDII